MKNFNVRRKIAIGAALVAVVGAGSFAGASQARSDFYYQYYFYSDANHTQMIGNFRQYCLNNTTIMTPPVTGEMSDFYTTEAIGRCPGLGDW